MENLSSKEIDILVEALESWEIKDFSHRIMGTLFRGIISDKMDPEVKAKMDENERIENDKMENDARQRKETSLILKAKLVMMKQQYSIDRLTHPS